MFRFMFSLFRMCSESSSQQQKSTNVSRHLEEKEGKLRVTLNGTSGVCVSAAPPALLLVSQHGRMFLSTWPIFITAPPPYKWTRWSGAGGWDKKNARGQKSPLRQNNWSHFASYLSLNEHNGLQPVYYMLRMQLLKLRIFLCYCQCVVRYEHWT